MRPEECLGGGAVGEVGEVGEGDEEGEGERAVLRRVRLSHSEGCSCAAMHGALVRECEDARTREREPTLLGRPMSMKEWRGQMFRWFGSILNPPGLAGSGGM
jgi:hypothetical protein